MPITIDPLTFVIYVPQSYLSLITGTLYELDTDRFRLDLKGIEDDEGGITFLATHAHNTEVTVAGVTYARTVEILPPYSITFEDGQYSVKLTGSNNNIFDIEAGVLNQNQVQVIPTNSAGLIVKSTGSGLSVEEHDKLVGLPEETEIADAVWAFLIEGGFTAAEVLKIQSTVLAGTVSGAGSGTEVFKGLDKTTDRVISTVDVDGNRDSVTLDVS